MIDLYQYPNRRSRNPPRSGRSLDDSSCCHSAEICCHCCHRRPARRLPPAPGPVDLTVEREVLLPAADRDPVFAVLRHHGIVEADRGALLQEAGVGCPPADVAVEEPPGLLVRVSSSRRRPPGWPGSPLRGMGRPAGECVRAGRRRSPRRGWSKQDPPFPQRVWASRITVPEDSSQGGPLPWCARQPEGSGARAGAGVVGLWPALLPCLPVAIY